MRGRWEAWKEIAEFFHWKLWIVIFLLVFVGWIFDRESHKR